MLFLLHWAGCCVMYFFHMLQAQPLVLCWLLRYKLIPYQQSGSHSQHLEYIQNAVSLVIALDKHKNGETFKQQGCHITSNDIIDSITSPEIVSAIAEDLIQKERAKQGHTCIKNCNRPTSPRKRELDITQCREPTQSACNCKCCVSDSNRHGVMTRHTKRTRDTEQSACLSCCKNSPQKKKENII